MTKLTFLYLKKENIIIKNYSRKIIKIERNQQEVCNCYIADSFFKRFKGLMLADPLLDNEGLFLDKTNSIHMFFMKYEIDVIFLDKDNKVIDMINSMKRRRVSKIYKNCKSVVELKSKSLLNLDIVLGDKLIFLEPSNG